MDKFVVEGIPAFNGDYPIDIRSFTMRELQIIKRMSGVRAGELAEAFEAGDTDVLLAIAVIAVRRNGKDWESFERIAWESDLSAITFVGGEEAADEPTPLTPTRPLDADEKNSEPRERSGLLSPDDGGDRQETNRRPIGSPA